MYSRKLLTIIAIAIGIASGVSAAEPTPQVIATDSATLQNDAPLIAAPEIEVIELTPEAEAPVIVYVETPAPEADTAPDSDVTMNVWQVVIGVGTLLITGMAAGGFGVLAFLRGVNQNPALMSAIEALANSRPDRERAIVNQIGDVLTEAGKAITEATDNVPAASKPVVDSDGGAG